MSTTFTKQQFENFEYYKPNNITKEQAKEIKKALFKHWEAVGVYFTLKSAQLIKQLMPVFISLFISPKNPIYKGYTKKRTVLQKKLTKEFKKYLKNK